MKLGIGMALAALLGLSAGALAAQGGPGCSYCVDVFSCMPGDDTTDSHCVQSDEYPLYCIEYAGCEIKHTMLEPGSGDHILPVVVPGRGVIALERIDDGHYAAWSGCDHKPAVVVRVSSPWLDVEFVNPALIAESRYWDEVNATSSGDAD